MTDAAAEMLQLVDGWSVKTGKTHAQVIDQVYKDLRKLAASYLRRERADHTLQATALVNEAYMRVFPGANFDWEDRTALFCIMARSMRQVLIDHARRHRSGKRGGGQKVSLNDVQISVEDSPEEAAALHEAINRLEQLNERQARVVELRYTVGLSIEETAAALNVSEKTVKNDWAFAKAWLQKELDAVDGSAGSARTAE